jgi:hypothetical protein
MDSAQALAVSTANKTLRLASNLVVVIAGIVLVVVGNCGLVVVVTLTWAVVVCTPPEGTTYSNP